MLPQKEPKKESKKETKTVSITIVIIVVVAIIIVFSLIILGIISHYENQLTNALQQNIDSTPDVNVVDIMPDMEFEGEETITENQESGQETTENN